MVCDYKGYRIEVYGGYPYWPTGAYVYKDGEFCCSFVPIGSGAWKKARAYVDSQVDIEEIDYIGKRIGELYEGMEHWKGDWTQDWSQTREGFLEQLRKLLGQYTKEPKEV